jgi:hypothetical protein
VIPSIEPGGEAVAGPFALQAPPLEIRVLLEPGEAGPEGPMPILREVIDA